MSQLPADTIFVVVPTPWLIVFAIGLSLCAVGLAVEITVEIIWAVKARKQSDILTSNSDISQEETKRVRAVKIS
jgi:hypothetical protein